jgi:hypothetical protein
MGWMRAAATSCAPGPERLWDLGPCGWRIASVPLRACWRGQRAEFPRRLGSSPPNDGLRANNDWSVALWAQNLFDMDYFTTLSTGGGFNVGMAYGFLGALRTCGVTVRKQF